MEENTSGQQAGGCDSSDCLFCQYRSNSPFHLNAYAGKLTTLLRKRSLNGMTLASLNSLVDATSEHGAALLSAATAAVCSGSKRHRAVSSNGVLAAAAAAGPSSGLQGPSLTPAAADESAPVAASTASTAEASRFFPHGSHEFSEDMPHDCLSMCGGRLCSGHPQTKPSEEAEAAAVEAPSTTRQVASGRASRASPAEPAPSSDFSHTTAQLPTGVSADGAAPRPPPPLDPATANAPAGPGPSSLLLMHLLQTAHRRQHIRHHQHNHHHHQPRGRLPHRPREGWPPQATTGPQPDRSPLQPPPQPDQQAQQHQGPQQGQQQGPQQQQQPRLAGGQPLPEGWTFRSEWRHRTDPAPAALQELLRLPGAASSAPRGGGRGGSRAASSSQSGPGGGACGGSTGIVCALEFSPDGRLLAAGGVDKQIRLYNLSGAFEGLGDELDEILEDGDDDEGLTGLGSQARGPGQQRHGDIGTCGAVRGRRGRCGDCNGDSEDEADDDGGDERDGSLLAVVQRMPSKISSMAWSPFMDGVLTVGDYDGVLLQLHIASGHQVADVEAHGGRKIWSVAHSTLTPHLAASAADDRCVRLWAGRGLATCVGTVSPNPRAAVCGVDFSPCCEHLLAAACSDRTAYLYDMRSLGRGPLAALRHHSRPTSYCRFLGGGRLVTAATDASLVLWDISEAVPSVTGVILPPTPTTPAAAPAQPASLLSPLPVVHEYGAEPAGPAAVCRDAAAATMAASAAPCSGGGDPARPCRVFRGHRNEKNFVGLSVRAADGLLACGSECSRAFAYHTSWSDPLATLELPWGSAVAGTGQSRGGGPGPAKTTAAGGDGGGGGGFVSAVCWQPAEAAAVLGLPPLLASATSMGAVNVSVLASRR
ncbi:hypothetical protein PLESTB_000816800 [Pleodorina starrii]|uniref:Uncharacterized protein n=1 Tax=Pleodorina starrii TaxID=330485 RepID=A0A9W6BMD2_9CHLO|nr:hypothetical protein PLESTB_000816800 [Pleodorina starrii]